MEGLGERVAELLHELSTLPWNDRGGEVPATALLVLTNYIFFMLVATALVVLFFAVASRRAALVPRGVGNVAEAGLEFIRNLAVDIIGPEGVRYFPFLATMFFFILFNNVFGLLPGSLPGTGSIGVTAALALVTWLVFVYVGFAKNGFGGYMKSMIPAGVREMGLFARIVLGGYIFLLEFVSTFLVRPFTLAVRLFANMYAGHIILGIFAAFVAMGIRGGLGLGLIPASLSLVMLVLMYAFEVFVAFIQAYVFTVLTAVYIGSSLHAAEH
ncbi:MAG: F0F1 ATP synthase subunit A [Coriobacteriia bacterium]|nr:F0F1 ATP synthase subunit A [Coriobacteriia bacterium]